MLRITFKDWMEGKIPELIEDYVSTEFIMPDVDEKLIALPFTKVLHESENCIGQIVVYEASIKNSLFPGNELSEYFPLHCYFTNGDR